MPSQDEDNADLPGPDDKTAVTEKKPVAAAAESKAAPVVSTPEKAAPQFTHSAYLTKRALQIGFTQADLDENPSDFLRAELERYDRWAAGERAKNQPAPAASQQAAPVVEKDPLDEITEDVFDPRMVAVAKTAKELRETVKKQAEALQQFTDRENQRTQTSIVETIDGVFNALDPKLYGKGEAATLAKGSAEVQRRFAVVRAAGLANGDTTKTIATKLQAAHNLLYPTAVAAEAAPEDAYAAAAGTEAKDPRKPGQFAPGGGRITPEQWAAGTTAKPTARNGAPEPKGKNAATVAVAQRMREQGMDPGPLSEAGEDDDLIV